MKWVAVFLLTVGIALTTGLFALLVAYLGYQFGVAGWFLALSVGLWLLYALLVTEYPLASGRGPKREDYR